MSQFKAFDFAKIANKKKKKKKTSLAHNFKR